MKSNLFYTILLLCACTIAVNAESPVVVNWTSPTASNLYSVHMITASDGWAVGSGGTIIRWNGTEWSIWPSPTTRRLLSLFVTSDSSGWAVGYHGTIIYWTGVEWIPELSTGILMLLLTGFTLVSFISAKKASKRTRAGVRGCSARVWHNEGGKE